MLQRHINWGWNCSSTLPLASALHWGEWSMPHSSCVPGKESQYPSQGCWVDHGWSEQLWKISSALRSKPQTIQPVQVTTLTGILATLKTIPLSENCFLSHYCTECLTGLNVFFFNIGKLHKSESVSKYICFRFLSLFFFLVACRELPLFVFCLSPLMFCCLRFEFLQMLDWGFQCLAVWCWVRGLVVSDVSKGGAIICSRLPAAVATPWLLQAGSGIRSYPRKPELFSLLSVLQHSTLLFVNLHNV